MATLHASHRRQGDPRYLQALRMLDRGLRALPSDDECARIFADFDGDPNASPELGSPLTVRERMGELFQECFDGGKKKYESLLEHHGTDNPHLNYLLAEVFRLGWRRWGRAEDRDAAVAGYGETLAVAPDHVAAALALGELLQTLGREPEAVARLDGVVTELLERWRPWDGGPAVEAGPRLADAERLVATAAGRFPETEAWRAFRARAESRIEAATAAKPKRRKL